MQALFQNNLNTGSDKANTLKGEVSATSRFWLTEATKGNRGAVHGTPGVGTGRGVRPRGISGAVLPECPQARIRRGYVIQHHQKKYNIVLFT